MSSSDNFLSRWSRRKVEARSPGLPPEEPASPPIDAPTACPPAVAATGAKIAPTLSPEELAALPSVEELTAESDIGVFLREGVPTLLRNAALRRMWSVDPAIRDFVGEARDYSYDWNVPGGVPGSGPLLPEDDVQSMLARLFPPKDQPLDLETAPEPDGPAPPPTPGAAEDVASPDIEIAAASIPLACSSDRREEERISLPATRRHGSAMPL